MEFLSVEKFYRIGERCPASLEKIWPLVKRHIIFNEIIPIGLHLYLGRHFKRADKAHTQEGGIGKVPNTLGQLRILLFPGGTGKIRAELRMLLAGKFG